MWGICSRGKKPPTKPGAVHIIDVDVLDPAFVVMSSDRYDIRSAATVLTKRFWPYCTVLLKIKFDKRCKFDFENVRQHTALRIVIITHHTSHSTGI